MKALQEAMQAKARRDLTESAIRAAEREINSFVLALRTLSLNEPWREWCEATPSILRMGLAS